MTAPGSLPLLWLCGPPGVGKTAVGWEIHSELTQEGLAHAYVDIDQLGICYPAAPSDPERHSLKTQNLAAVAAGFAAAGARGVIVSGVVDPRRGPAADLLPDTSVTLCRLRAERAHLEQRFLARGGSQDALAGVLAEADALDATAFAPVTVETAGRAVAEVARLGRSRTAWPEADVPNPAPEPPEPGPSTAAQPTEAAEPHTAAGGTILWVCGPTGVGKSTVGWRLWQLARRNAGTGAYIDLDQLGFCSAVPVEGPARHRLRATNLAAVWTNDAGVGARFGVIVGPVEDPGEVAEYTRRLPAATVILCRLHADDQELTECIRRRGQGGGHWAAPGDPLLGRDDCFLRSAAEEASAVAVRLDTRGIGNHCVDTSGRSVDEVVETIVARTGWPPTA